MKKLFVCVALIVGIVGSASATQVYTNAFASIYRIGTYSKFHLDPTFQGYVRVFFALPVTWTSGACDTGSVFVRKDDSTLIAAVQAAMASDRSIQVFSDDTIAAIAGICTATYIQSQ